MNYLPIYVAVVTQTGLGDSGRAIKCGNEFVSSEAGLVYPVIDGLFKLPAPAVNENVLVLQLDATYDIRYYLPIRSDFSTLTDSNSAAQLESSGNIELDATAIQLGAAATEGVIKGATFNGFLKALIDLLAAHVHTSAAPGSPTTPPVTATLITATKDNFDKALSSKTTVE